MDGREVQITASIGVALDDGSDAEALVANADAAMYLAKRRGRARCELYDQSLRAEVVRRLETEAALRDALVRSELRVHYQPIVALDGSLHGLEALVRWERPGVGLVPPLEFIPLSEESNLVVDIGTFVLEEATARAVALRRDGRLPEGAFLAVNVSARQLVRDDLVPLVRRAAADMAAAGVRLGLEITESVAVNDPEATVKVLHELRAAGAALAIDDFGAGYTCLGYLKRFPVDVLKIDRTFVQGVGHDLSDTAIVAAMTSIGHGLGLMVLAEGVETEEQRAQLAAMGCDLAQGFLWSRPVPADEIPELPVPGAATGSR